MLTQLNCPQCRTPFTAEVFQVVDVGQTPQLKQLLLSGRLNVATCPNCGFTAQLGTPLLYHDPAHDMFMVFVPMELNLSHNEQQRLIGDMVQQIINQTPPEKRRGYMLQPQTILSYQTLIEKVLETEGITPEMIAHQRKQGELLQTLSTASPDVVDILLQERANMIDETFFAMLSSVLQASTESNNMEQTLKLTNLQARLYQETEVGKRLERQQTILHRFRQAAKKQGGLSPELLFEYVTKYAQEDALVDGLTTVGQPALNYTFFGLLTDEIERLNQGGEQARASRLTAIRERLLQVQAKAQRESQAIMDEASKVLQAITRAPDQRAAVQEHLHEMDEAFMYLLSMTIAQAEQAGAQEQFDNLTEIRELILEEVESQTPPELRFLNDLMEAETPAQQDALLTANPEMVSPRMVELLRMLAQQTDQAGDSDTTDRLKSLEKLVASRL
ncbi:MAG: CpXC domain-containing protein [Ardenticatenales bacterium]|nr:CpXC domain-containing protein [Ardenticatenales bacterium]